MNLQELFTSHKTEPPQLGNWYFVLLGIVVAVIYLSYKYYQNQPYQQFFKWMQIIQLLFLYVWYAATLTPVSESLPLYHCRIAMFAMILLPDRSVYKLYFAFLGTFGSIAAFVYPVFDPFPFPHITILSFIIGHLALLGNCLIYLFNNFDSQRITWQRIAGITFVINAFLLIVNGVTQGAYGFLKHPPIVGDQGMLNNFLLISFILSFMTNLVYFIFKKIRETEAVSLLQEQE